MKIFRYLRSEWAISSLEGRHLKFSDPKKFNDPFEISPNFDISRYSDREVVRRLLKEDHVIKEAWNELNPKLFGNYENFKRHWLSPHNIEAEIERRLKDLPVPALPGWDQGASASTSLNFRKSLSKVLTGTFKAKAWAAR